MSWIGRIIVSFFSKIRKKKFHPLYNFLKQLWNRWNDDRVSSYAASLAFYSIFSLAPLIIICTSIVGLTIGHELAETQIMWVTTLLIGTESAKLVHTMILNSSTTINGVTAGTISFIILLIGASGIFTQIQIGLNVIFPVEKKKRTQGLFKFFIDKFFSFALVLGVAFLLLVSLIISITLSFLSDRIISVFQMQIELSWGVDFIISVCGITFLFALLYKILPEKELKWSEIFSGSLISALLFIFGKFLLGMYLGAKHVDNAFGPAGSLVIILIWLYYSAHILFLGAEIIMIKKLRKKS